MPVSKVSGGDTMAAANPAGLSGNAGNRPAGYETPRDGSPLPADHAWNLEVEANHALPPREPPTSDTVRPEGDTRTARQIIDSNPLLKNLGQKHKEELAKQVGDLQHDPDAAYRAIRVLDYVERYDEKGKEIISRSGVKNIGNGKVDGYTSHDEAKPQTEAGRLQDFDKYGYNFLKDDHASPKPKPDAVGPDTFPHDLEQDATKDIVDKAKLPSNRKDILDHPERYTAQQRYAARLELRVAYENMAAQISIYGSGAFTKDVPPNGDTHPSDWHLNSDPTKEVQGIQDAIKKLGSPEVEDYEKAHEVKDVQDFVRSDPKRLEQAKAMYADMKDHAAGLDKFVGAGKDTVEGMRAYVKAMSTLNQALGTDGKPADDDFSVNIKDSPQGKAIMDSYMKDFQDPGTLDKLIKDKGMSEGDAMDELNARAGLFATFGSPLDDLEVSVNENITNHLLGAVAPKDFDGSGVIGADGQVDEKFVNAALDKVRQDDPESAILRDENNKPLSNAQIITATRGAFDAFRNLSKVNSALPKANLQQFMSQSNALQKAFGTGAMHAVSALLGAGISIARANPGHPLSTEEKIAAAGNGIQAFGVATQGFQFTQRKNPAIIEGKWGQAFKRTPPADPQGIEMQPPADPSRPATPASTGNPPGTTTPPGEPADPSRPGTPASTGNPPGTTTPTGQPKTPEQLAQDAYNKKIATRSSNIMNFGKLLNGTGGAMAGGAGIAIGISELKKGNKAGAALALTQGSSNSATALGPLVESLAPRVATALGKPLAALAIQRIFIIGGSISAGLNVVGFLAAIGYEIYHAVQDARDAAKYAQTFAPTLKNYGIDGGKDTGETHAIPPGYHQPGRA